MAQATQEGNGSGEGRILQEPQAIARLPASTWLLAWLTTSPWRNDPPLTEPVARYLDRMTSEGWMIRQASPRNFVIWRGATPYGRKQKLLVLPGREVRLRTLERSAVATGLVTAAISRTVDDRLAGEKLAEADRFACDLGFPDGMVELTTYLTSANRKIQAALAPSWADLVDERY